MKKTNVAGRKAWVTLQNDYSPRLRYLYFDVADGFLGLGNKPVKVTICYLDAGQTHFEFQYDSADPTLSGLQQRFRIGHVQQLQGTGKWKEVSFIIPHALFSGRTNGDDFRLACVDADLIVHSVAMRRAE